MAECIRTYDSTYQEYLRDESGYSGHCESISFPACAEEAVSVAKSLWHQRIPITVQGARTGICGGAVPSGGHVMCTERMNHIYSSRVEADSVYLTVSPGVRLSELGAATRRLCPGFSFLPNPTEISATIGGAFACNARGINDIAYGSVGQSVSAIEVLLSDGSMWHIPRGKYVFGDAGCPLPDGRWLNLKVSATDCGGYSGPLSVYKGADLLDIFAGSEGTLGIILSLELKLRRQSAEKWGVMFFFSDKDSACSFTQALHDQTGYQGPVSYTAVEFLHRSALKLIDSMRERINALNDVPDFPQNADCAIYVELEGNDSDAAYEKLLEIFDIFISVGGNEENTWAATGESQLMKFHHLRHAVPEAANLRVSEARKTVQTITKLASDFTFTPDKLKETIELYEQGLLYAGLSGVIFGHIYRNRIHVNLFPENREQYLAGTVLLRKWAAQVSASGGCIVSENGVGKLKKAMLHKNIGEARLESAKQLKQFFDAAGLLNPKNVF